MNDLTKRILIPAICLSFILAGVSFIPYAGIQNDEALFSAPIYQQWQEFGVRAGHHTIPLMLISYLGTLKTLLYWPLFAVVSPGLYSTRLPMVLAGAVTIWVFFYLAKRVAGWTAAVIATLLLATDPTFILTNTFDWGPVALEHLLLVTGCFFLVRFAQESERSDRRLDLAVGFLCFGLALWNKALFLWALSGLVAGTLVVLRHELVRLTDRRVLRIAAAAAMLGALPFLIYNVRHPNTTVGANANLEVPDWNVKLHQVQIALDGSALFGYIVAEEWRENPKTPTSLRGRVALFVREHLGEHQAGGMAYACLACLALAPLWWRSRVARFSLVFMVVSWLLMAVTKGAGASAHHVVLLWPFPQLFVAVTLAQIRWRAVVIGATVVLVVLNLLVISQYILQFERDGAAAYFSDALPALSHTLTARGGGATPGGHIYVIDWGIQNSLALLSAGRLHLEVADGPFQTDTPDVSARKEMDAMFTDPQGLFVGHVPGQEVFTGVRDRLDRAAQAAGLHSDLVQLVGDSNGRPMFQIFRLVPGARAATVP